MSIEGEILGRDHSPQVEANRHTVEDAIRRYKEVELSRKTRKHNDQVAQLDWWARELGHLKLAQLSGPLICGCRDKLVGGKTVQGKPRQPATVNRYLAALSHVLRVTTRDWGWMPESPMNRVRKLKEPRGRVRYLSELELPVLLRTCAASTDPHLNLIVLLALATGMRRGEIVGLRWSAIDCSRRRIILDRTKNGERRAVPLPLMLLDAFKSRFPADDEREELVFRSVKSGFEGRTWDFTRAWRRAVANAGIEGFRFHDLRHSCASYLAMTGATTNEIAEILGHKTLQMVKRYAHLCDSHVEQVLNRMIAQKFPVEVRNRG